MIFPRFRTMQTLDDKNFSSNAGDALRGRGETKYHDNRSERSLCQISHDPSVKTGQGDGKSLTYINRRYGHIVRTKLSN